MSDKLEMRRTLLALNKDGQGNSTYAKSLRAQLKRMNEPKTVIKTENSTDRTREELWCNGFDLEDDHTLKEVWTFVGCDDAETLEDVDWEAIMQALICNTTFTIEKA